MPGKFIVVEGLDSDYIDNQAGRLAEWMHSEALPVVVAREPTDGPIGAQIRLIQDGRLNVHEVPRAVFFLADRMDHLYRKQDGVLAELDKNLHVICVRYLLSAYAYQSDTVDLDWLKKINCFCPPPDLMIFIDLTVDSCVERLVRQNGYDAEQVETNRTELTKRRESYLHVISQYQQDGWNIAVVNGGQSTENVHRACRDLTMQLLRL